MLLPALSCRDGLGCVDEVAAAAARAVVRVAAAPHQQQPQLALPLPAIIDQVDGGLQPGLRHHAGGDLLPLHNQAAGPLPGRGVNGTSRNFTVPGDPFRAFFLLRYLSSKIIIKSSFNTVSQLILKCGRWKHLRRCLL